MAKLATYRAKRDFTKTSEPKGEVARNAGSHFVVQKHVASRLHYDFRFELGGVLKSWAVARGPSLVAGEKRLAVEVEDHPVAYGSFEGTIPEGEYGGGTVMLWDRGRWIPDGDPDEGYAKGRLGFRLEGEKLRGAWHLLRMKKRPGERQPSWLLVKTDDAEARSADAPDILEEAPLSVKSGRSLDEIAGRPVEAKTAAPKKAKKAPARTSTAKAGKAPARKKSAPADAVEIAGVPITHPDRVLWEDQGVTKRELAEYYVGVADWILPHVVERPLTLVRCPAGAKKACFFQKHAWAGLSDFIQRRSLGEGEPEALIVRDIRGVVALAQAGVLEIHPWGARIDDVERPDRVVFDFDPGEGVAWPAVVEAAREMHERLDALGLRNFVKTTGGKGLHVVVPLTPSAGWKEAKAFTKALSDAMVADRPERYTTTSVKSEREGRIFIDYLRNTRGATAVAPYSTRARAGAPVAVPLSWEDLSEAVPSNHFTVETLGHHLRDPKDPWAEFRSVKQTLPDLPKRRRRR